jgi:hypothetical protein
MKKFESFIVVRDAILGQAFYPSITRFRDFVLNDALLAVVYVSHVEDRFLGTPRL